jgi:hypothetical protein
MSKKKEKKVKVPAKKTKSEQVEVKADETIVAGSRATKELVEKQMLRKFGNKHGASTIDEILGEKINPYEQKNDAEYEAFISDLNYTDLERHATEVGVAPRRDRDDLEKSLLKQFAQVNSSFYNGRIEQPVKAKISKKVLDILSEGR